MNRKARNTIEQFDMLRQGDTVIAAVSGGADSVALLDFLCSLPDLGLHVRACHLNHCLRGEESERDEQLVRTMCAQYGVPLDVRRVEVKPLARARGLSIEQAARNERYTFFEDLAVKLNSKIATAHTLSDTAETVLFNLARGTGIAGMCGIPPVRGTIIRPLIACSRAEIEDYCAARGLCYVTDSTNLSDDYTRNHIRHNVIPQLYRVNSGALEAIGRMISSLRQDADYLASEAIRIAAELEWDGGIDASKLSQQHPAIRSRIVSGLLEHSNIERSAERISLIEAMLSDGRKHTLQLGRSDYAVVREGILRLEHRQKSKRGTIELRALNKTKLDGVILELECGKTIEFSLTNCTDYEISENNTKLVLKNVVDYDKISIDIFIRARQAGDRIKTVGRGCTKSLKKLYSELALPARERLCVLADSEGVIFAEGAGVDERVQVDTTTKTMLTFCILDQKTEEDSV